MLASENKYFNINPHIVQFFVAKEKTETILQYRIVCGCAVTERGNTYERILSPERPQTIFSLHSFVTFIRSILLWSFIHLQMSTMFEASRNVTVFINNFLPSRQNRAAEISSRHVETFAFTFHLYVRDVLSGLTVRILHYGTVSTTHCASTLQVYY